MRYLTYEIETKMSVCETTSTAFQVRKMTENDIENVLQSGKQLGWQLGKYENQIIMNIDSNGLFIAENKETGKAITKGAVHE